MKVKVLLSVICLTFPLMSGCSAGGDSLTVLVGTYTGGSSNGIYTYRLNTKDLTAERLSETSISNPSYLTLSPDGKFVYAVSESGAESFVEAFTFDSEKGVLSRINKVLVSADPCYIVADPKQRFVATANYSGGNFTFIPLDVDGGLKQSINIHSFSGHGADSIRQAAPHLHCVAVSPDKRAIFATDLGTDRIYKIDLDTRTGDASKFINPENISETALEPRSGPRHLIFGRNGRHAYLINELSGKVTVFAVDLSNKLTELQSITADTCNAHGSADIHLSPDEKFLYASTRLRGDGIVVFRVQTDGKIERVGYQPTGKHPRNFAITPDGSLMLVACGDAGMIQIFSIDRQTGALTDTGKSILIDRPVCIKFANI
ncbi:MAG: lactonase family protein [Tannerella sp.]|jgi:6-phosphogluconolactonase (cycloisomerase 2 family)|nr:lactonase family protein [Tannerella sp.]